MSDSIIPCLDKGYVRLVDHMGSDLSVVRAARVSYNADWRAGDNEKNDAKLIKYLWDHKHTTPFEAGTLTFEIKAPIFVFRQWHRHRTQSYNEVSARYTELPDEFYIPAPEVIGKQSAKNKQAREFSEFSYEERENLVEQIAEYQHVCERSFQQYRYLLGRGWPRELARMCLPLSTYSRMFTTLNLRNLFHFIELRLEEHAQYEIRVYADALLSLTRDHFPVCCDAFIGPDKVTYTLATT